jgi:elongation factor G
LDTLRNIGIVAHIDAGKTTLTEQLLVLSGFLRSPGSVEDGTTVADWRRPERERGITIGSAAVTVPWRGHEVTIVDTPGHVDFTLEVERTLTVIEGVVLVLSAPDGVQAQTQTVWHQAARHRLPAIAFVNKLDRPGADDGVLQEQIREHLGLEPVPLQVLLEAHPERLRLLDLVSGQVHEWCDLATRSGPRAPVSRTIVNDDEEFELLVGRERLADAISPYDDALTVMLLDDQVPTESDWRRAIGAAVRARGCLPLLYGVARAGVGPAQLLDAVVDYLPSPAQAPPRTIFDCRSPGTTASWPPADPQPTTAFVFKTEWRGRDRRIAWFRVFAGAVTTSSRLARPRDATEIAISEIVRLMGGSDEPVSRLADGTIGAIISHPGVALPLMGDTLAEGVPRWAFEPVAVPAPVIAVALEAPDPAADLAMREALAELVTDDPSLAVVSDPATGQTLLLGMGELHLELVTEELLRDRQIACRVGSPRAHLRRTIARSGEGAGEAIDDSLPGITVRVGVRLDPTELSGAAQIAPICVPLPDPTAEDPVLSGLRHALLDVEDLVQARMEVTVISAAGGTPTPRSYWLAAVSAARAAIAIAGSGPAEPWVALDISVPDETVGRVTGDLAKRRARIHSASSRGTLQTLTASAPLAEMLHYATLLRSMTSGRGTFSMRPIGYRPC